MTGLRRAGVALAAALLFGVAACGGASPASYVETFGDARVELSAHYEPGTDGSGTLVATFTPTEAATHLYGAELPRSGIDGAGRPTLLEVTDAHWRATGPIEATVAAEPVSLAGFDEPFPIYPDGPVTLRLPVARVGDDDDAVLASTVTFMACTSTGLCYLPVMDHAIGVPAK